MRRLRRIWLGWGFELGWAMFLRMGMMGFVRRAERISAMAALKRHRFG